MRDQKPAWCYAVESAVSVLQVVPQDYLAKVFFIGAGSVAGGYFSYDLCTIFSNEETNKKCTPIGKIVGEGLALVGIGAVVYHDWPLRGTAAAVGKRHELIQGKIERYLRSRGIEFEAVESVRVLRRNEKDGDIASTKVMVRGLRDESGNVSDHELSIRDDNKGIARVSFPFRSSDGTLLRRSSGPGLKISYDFYHVMLSDFADEEGIKALSYNVGEDWRRRMENHHDWANYIATMEFGPSFKMALHITPELDAFENSWEDPNVCGKVEI
ncbi:hypothetical protein DL765_002662 [Monosporascus sp. GIB2]|nr:hypothetical protein DL765_002662 [Monosporascus sp. GIB2]